MMKIPHKKIEEYLQTLNSRYTTQKQAIIEQIASTDGHFEVDDFMVLIKRNEKVASTSRATVYRFIKQLLDGGFLQKITTREGKVYYERTFIKKQHDHLICNSCGKILEIIKNEIDQTLNSACKKLNFHPEYRSLHIYGLCNTCSTTK